MLELADTAATDALGHRLAVALMRFDQGLAVSLAGELGVGKTALARATLVRLGHSGTVVSPSYTLVEPYPVAGRTLYHLDLYRLGAPEELEFLGIREIDVANDWLLVEWAGHGHGFLPTIDVAVALAYAPRGRTAQMTPLTERGQAFCVLLDHAV